MKENFDCIVDNGQIIDISSKNGWVCPKCGSVIAPTILVCPICGGKRTTNENLNDGEQMIFEN